MTDSRTLSSATRPRQDGALPGSPPARGLRLALAIVAPLGALGVVINGLVAPYTEFDPPAVVLDAVAANPGAVGVMSWAWLLTAITLVPGVLAAGLAALRGAPRLATAGLLIALPGWAAALSFPDTNGIARAMVASGATGPESLGLLDYLTTSGSPALGAATAVFVIGHIVGTVLLGLALIRARAVPVVIGVLLAVSTPLHFVAFVILGSVWLDIAAYGLTALGFGAAGIAYYRQAARS